MAEYKTVNRYPLRFLDYAIALKKANDSDPRLITSYEVTEDEVIITVIKMIS